MSLGARKEANYVKTNKTYNALQPSITMKI